MKSIAVLKYTMMFDPSVGWTSGSQFEGQLADFFAAHGFEAEVVESRGGTGERIIWLERIDSMQKVAQTVPQPKNSKPATEQIRRAQVQQPTKSFKQFHSRGVPKSFVNQDKRSPKQIFNNSGRPNSQKVRTP